MCFRSSLTKSSRGSCREAGHWTVGPGRFDAPGPIHFGGSRVDRRIGPPESQRGIEPERQRAGEPESRRARETETQRDRDRERERERQRDREAEVDEAGFFCLGGVEGSLCPLQKTKKT